MTARKYGSKLHTEDYGPWLYARNDDLGLGQLVYFGPISWDAIGDIEPDQALQFVYHLVDTYGNLLYIGTTRNPTRRLTEHCVGKPWWREVHCVGIYVYYESDAGVAEARDIRSLGPAHNVTGRA